jgi:ATP-dependent protease ClpP protease subunit
MSNKSTPSSSSNSVNLIELLGEEPQGVVAPYMRNTKMEINSYTVFLDDAIGPPSMYRDLVYAMYNATESDEFNLIIASSGGDFGGCCSIIEAIRGTAATVRGILTGECHSAASIITMNCHEVYVTESAWMLVHTAQYGQSGNSHQMKGYVDFSTKQVEAFVRKTYAGFLTEAEIEDVLKGVELIFDHTEITERLKGRIAAVAATAQEVEVVEDEPRKKKKPKPPTTEMLTE